MDLAISLSEDENIRLLARDDVRNIRRGYRIERSVDLFGHHIVEWGWGRVGTAGEARQVSFAEQTAAVQFVRTLLRRRDSAPRRLGVPYRPCP